MSVTSTDAKGRPDYAYRSEPIIFEAASGWEAPGNTRETRTGESGRVRLRSGNNQDRQPSPAGI